MTGNPYRGEVTLDVGGETVTLRFTWDAIARLRQALGEDYDTVITQAFNTQDVESIAHVVSIGSVDDLDPAAVMAASPPVIPTINACLDAIHRAYYGPDGPPEALDENPRKARAATWWRRLTARLFGPVSADSGS